MGYQDNYSKTLFLNAYGKAKPLKPNEDYQKYFTYECNITNPRAYHEQLISDGYLSPCSIPELLSTLKVAELKEMCDNFSISKGGKKQEIIERLVQNVSAELLNKYTNKAECFSLSKKGTAFLSSHQDYLDLHQNSNYDISLSEYERVKAHISSDDFYQIALDVLCDRLKSNDSSCLRNTYFSLATLHKHNKNWGQSLTALLHVLFFDINSTPDLNLLNSVNAVNELYHFYGFAPGLIKEIVDLQSVYSPNMIDEVYRKYSHLALLCSQELFEKIVNEIFTLPQINARKYAEIFRENLINYLKTNRLITTRSQSNTNAEYNSSDTSVGSGCLAGIIIIVIFIVLVIIIF